MEPEEWEDDEEDDDADGDDDGDDDVCEDAERLSSAGPGFVSMPTSRGAGGTVTAATTPLNPS